MGCHFYLFLHSSFLYAIYLFIILADNHLSLIHPMLQSIWYLKLQFKFLLKKKNLKKVSVLIQQNLLEVFIGSLYLENPNQYRPISHFLVMDTYIFQSYWWRCMQCIYSSFISAIYIHTHCYSNNKTYKSFQVITSGPRKPIHHFGLLRFSAINLLSCLT